MANNRRRPAAPAPVQVSSTRVVGGKAGAGGKARSAVPGALRKPPAGNPTSRTRMALKAKKIVGRQGRGKKGMA